MSRGQLARTPANFPKMKYRAAARDHKGFMKWRAREEEPRGTYTGGYRCPEHGIIWDWDNVDAREMDAIEADIADHEYAWHGDDE